MNEKRVKLQELQSLETKMQIFKICVGPHGKDPRFLGVNWTKKEDKGIKND